MSRRWRAMPRGSLVLPGTFPIRCLPDINVDITNAAAGDYTTTQAWSWSHLAASPPCQATALNSRSGASKSPELRTTHHGGTADTARQ